MADRRPIADLSDDELGAALRALAASLAVPPGPASLGDPARLARLRLEAAAAPGASHWTWGHRHRSHLRRSAILALVALVVLAAIAGAVGLGVPGIRLVPAGSGSPTLPPQTPPPPSGSAISSGPPSAGALGAGLGLGSPIALAAADGAVGFDVALPDEPSIGRPASAWLLEGRLSLVWPSGPALPALQDPSIGLVLSQFRGSLDPGYFVKIINPRTRIEPVSVAGVTGWWISGEPHGIVYVLPGGEPRFDGRRTVGDTLIWAVGDITYRLESALGRDAAIDLADRLR